MTAALMLVIVVIRTPVKLAYNKTRMVTEKGEYLFHFEERSTFFAEMAEFVKIPIAGLSTTQKKIDKEPDEITRVLRGQRAAILFLQSQREIGVGLLEKLLKLDRPAAEKFYSLYRDQYNPDLTVPDSVVEEWIAVGTFRAKEKITVKPHVVYDWTFAERAKR